jgi:hypothetical protein
VDDRGNFAEKHRYGELLSTDRGGRAMRSLVSIHNAKRGAFSDEGATFADGGFALALAIQFDDPGARLERRGHRFSQRGHAHRDDTGSAQR